MTLILFYYFNINLCIFQTNSEDPDETPHNDLAKVHTNSKCIKFQDMNKTLILCVNDMLK